MQKMNKNKKPGFVCGTNFNLIMPLVSTMGCGAIIELPEEVPQTSNALYEIPIIKASSNGNPDPRCGLNKIPVDIYVVTPCYPKWNDMRIGGELGDGTFCNGAQMNISISRYPFEVVPLTYGYEPTNGQDFLLEQPTCSSTPFKLSEKNPDVRIDMDGNIWTLSLMGTSKYLPKYPTVKYDYPHLNVLATLNCDIFDVSGKPSTCKYTVNDAIR